MALKQKHVDAAREARLWIRDILVPIIGVILAIKLKDVTGGSNGYYDYK